MALKISISPQSSHRRAFCQFFDKRFEQLVVPLDFLQKLLPELNVLVALLCMKDAGLLHADFHFFSLFLRVRTSGIKRLQSLGRLFPLFSIRVPPRPIFLAPPRFRIILFRQPLQQRGHFPQHSA
jgi:hypothetical protein